MNPLMCMATVLGLSLSFGLAVSAAEAVVLHAEAFGVKGDGVADDGPAVQCMLDAAAATGAPVCLKFRPDRTVRVESAPERYVFHFDEASHVTLDGGGSTFLLGPRVRFLRLSHSSHFAVRNLSIDFDPWTGWTCPTKSSRESLLETRGKTRSSAVSSSSPLCAFSVLCAETSSALAVL